ncbi:unnamed protein product [Lathyrus sativus]|nr:unnamed protein product [Lathyrus sativus]
MKMKKLNTLFLIFMLLTFVQCSSSTRIYRTKMEGARRHIATSIKVAIARFKKEGVSVGTFEDSARKVPTGPDPLHHNNHPLQP